LRERFGGHMMDEVAMEHDAAEQSRTSLVRFEPTGRTFAVRQGGSLWRAALRARLPIASSCRGQGACLACKVRVLSGEENLNALTPRESKLGLKPGERLACMAEVQGPVTITASYW
jgi:ferredoxin